MTTAAQRMVALSGIGAATAGQHLRAIGTGNTAAALLLFGSPLSSGSAAAHLLADRAEEEPEIPGKINYSSPGSRHRRLRRRKKRRDDELMFCLGVI